MDKITNVCRRHPVEKNLDSGHLIMRTFHNEMKQRFRIALVIVEIFKNDICFMVDTDLCYSEVV